MWTTSGEAKAQKHSDTDGPVRISPSAKPAGAVQKQLRLHFSTTFVDFGPQRTTTAGTHQQVIFTSHAQAQVLMRHHSFRRPFSS